MRGVCCYPLWRVPGTVRMTEMLEKKGVLTLRRHDVTVLRLETVHKVCAMREQGTTLTTPKNPLVANETIFLRPYSCAGEPRET